ncbi:MAG: tyrosine phosphatase family protein [Methylobacteriaceae bacterium]|nr:tyrosine phosphatase family protein [Methylobacteriaceae bacterium]MBV9246231.1 tyrosine phosphatase family protein [Methylobacteriaceae bacterium]
MPSIHVCPLSKIEAVVHATGARSLVTLLSAGTQVTRPQLIARERHLHLVVSDIIEAMDGEILPGEHHVRDLVAFAGTWDRKAPMLVHCFAGVSRSTAAAFISACVLVPEASEHDLARRLRQASHTATPNRRLVALADDHLGRRGRMVDAIAAIGTGASCFEGVEFELPLH